MDSSTNFKILIIDDNLSIHHDFIKILKTEQPTELDQLNAELFGKKPEKNYLPQFEIDTASQGQEGVEKIKLAMAQSKPYALAFVDIRMPPGWDGVETIKHIWEIDPDIQIVICTAYSDYSWEETIENLGKTDNLLILKKPFDNVSVRQLACALTTKWQLSDASRKYLELLKKQVADRTQSLQKSLSLVKSTFESSSDGILVFDNDRNIVDYNQKFIEMLSIPSSITESKSEVAFIEYLTTHLENHDEYVTKLKELQNKKAEISIDVLTFKNGKIFECYTQPHKQNEKIIGRILDFRDITKRAHLEQELQYQATHDPLTGLCNRVKLLEQLKAAIKSSMQSSLTFGVVFIDLDRFKLINDSLSHMAGDALLKSVAERLSNTLRPQDTLARLGGDEFVVVFTNITRSELENKSAQLLLLFQQPFAVSDRNVTLTASLGISVYPKDGTTADILLRNADAAMYRAKAQKGNSYVFYSSEMSMQSLQELDQEIELRHALTNNEFFLCYQPQLDINDEKLVAVEALIRWNHPTKGVLLPMEFIPLAEETGLIVPISDWVLRTACIQNKAWQDEGLQPIRVAVNVTAQQFNQQNIIEKVRNILAETQLKPEYLEVELTENVILSNREIVKSVTELKKLGVRIAIDDFGTGYSTLSYLHMLPLDRLKIDSSFIQHIQSENDDEVIIRAVIAMAKNLNLEVLAEGVETAEQLRFLKTQECGGVQGYYYSKPLLKTELEAYLKNPNHIKTISQSINEK